MKTQKIALIAAVALAATQLQVFSLSKAASGEVSSVESMVAYLDKQFIPYMKTAALYLSTARKLNSAVSNFNNVELSEHLQNIAKDLAEKGGAEGLNAGEITFMKFVEVEATKRGLEVPSIVKEAASKAG